MSAALIQDGPSGSDAERIGTATFVLSLRAKGVVDTNVLRAMETVPRDLFAPRRFADLSRSDVALPLACGQTMTSPGTVAAMLVALDLKPGQRVLEIGTGSGYVSALMARIGGEIRSLERQSILAESARNRLAVAGLADHVAVAHGDGLAAGLAEGRFDRIILNGVVASVPAHLTSRLVAGGRLVAGLAGEGAPRLAIVCRMEDGELRSSTGAPLRLSPLTIAENLDAMCVGSTLT